MMPTIADKLQAATTGSRELDADIFILVTPGVLSAGRIDRDGGVVGWLPVNMPYQSAREVPRYTTSLDDAVTLVPDTLYWLAGYGRDSEQEPLGGCIISSSDNPDEPLAEGQAATVPLAVCIASLTARHLHFAEMP